MPNSLPVKLDSSSGHTTEPSQITVNHTLRQPQGARHLTKPLEVQPFKSPRGTIARCLDVLCDSRGRQIDMLCHGLAARHHGPNILKPRSQHHFSGLSTVRLGPKKKSPRQKNRRKVWSFLCLLGALAGSMQVIELKTLTELKSFLGLLRNTGMSGTVKTYL
ncbi:hypothetical protein BJV78DRAFT_1215299 [Lactifluus subvellereus]|nr:hypothetical protein BJV78DRAFT_1215299 [Lactifluus subvellereus]